MHINEVNINHIERLSDIQLTELLYTLLRIELQKNQLDGKSFVPFNITTGDGGEDGRIHWSNGPERIKWFPNRLCLFQNKATVLTPEACFEEILKPVIKKNKKKSVEEKAGQKNIDKNKTDTTKRVLKERVAEIVESNGAYILFTNYNLNTQQKDERIKKFREAIKLAGYSNYNTLIIDVYDTNTIKDWVNENIAAITLVQKFNEITRDGFQTWDEWKMRLSGSEIPFKYNDKNKQYINTIIGSVQKKSPLRIIGHSGIGKTRLVLEAFNNESNDKNIQALKDQLVYFELNINGNLAYLVNYIISHRSQTGILVIDSCDEDAHKALSGTVNSLSKFSLITIDTISNTLEENFLKIERSEQKEIVNDIINDLLSPSHNKNDIEYLNNVCEGYPWMAVNFCNAIRKNGFNNFSGLLPKVFIKKLLFSDNSEDELHYSVIRACSVFSSFGLLDPNLKSILSENEQNIIEDQSTFIRQNILDQEVSQDKFYNICRQYIDKDIIEKRGTNYVVKPTILAMNLAADWLRNTPPTKTKKIIQDLIGSQLGERFVERLTNLDELDEALTIVKELWGPNSPFGSAEVLNTQWGSILFRYVVEVNPIETSKALKAAFGNYSKSELLNIEKGRRNLVWALEKLCFRKESFSNAARILYAFAAAENETWGNNATNQFIQLFQVFLSGTEASLEDRLNIIRFGLTKQDEDYNRIAILALGRAILNDQYQRIMGAEKQGSKGQLSDYEPSTSEILAYWKTSIDILTNFACSDNSVSKLAKEKLAVGFRTLIRDGLIEEVSTSIIRITTTSSEYWIDGLNALKRVLKYEEKLTEDTIFKLKDLIKLFEAKSLKDKLFLTVSKPDWHDIESEQTGNLIDVSAIKAQELAESLVVNNLDWEEFIPVLLFDEQRQAYSFGKKLGELTFNKYDLINKFIYALKSIQIDKININLIIGFLNGANDKELNDYVIENFISDKKYNFLAFSITSSTSPTYEDIAKLFDLVDGVHITAKNFNIFQYGRALDQLSPAEVIKLCKSISDFNKQGKWTALSMLFMYVYGDENRWNLCKDFIETLISSENFLINNRDVHIMESYHWASFAKKLLSDINNYDFAKIITNQIIEMCSNRILENSFSSYIEGVFNRLTDNFLFIIWPIIGAAIIGDYITFFHLKHYITGSPFFQKNILFNENHKYDYLLDWLKDAPPVGVERIANIMPIKNITNDKVEWHPFALSIIDKYGNNNDVLKQISSNMGSFGIVGSTVPYFLEQKKLLMQLKDHPNFNVQDWVENMLDYTDKMIAREMLRDEEDKFK